MIRNYNIFAISFLLSFINFMIFYSYPFMLDKFGIVEVKAGLIVGISTIFTLLMRIISGILIDRFRLYWAIFITSLLYCISLFMLNADQKLLVVVSRVLLGILLGCMSTFLMYYSIIKSNNGREKANNVSMITFFNVLPTSIAPFIALKITQIWGSDYVAIIAFYMFIICVLLSFILDMQTKFIGGDIHNESLSSIGGLNVILSDPNPRVAIIILAFIYVISGTTVTFLPSYLISSGISDPSIYFLIYTLSMILPRLLLKRYIPSSNIFPIKLLLICTFTALFGTLSNYLLSDNNYLYFIGAIFCGFSLGFIYPIVMSYVVCCFNKNLEAHHLHWLQHQQILV